jgi:hypothetical protein
MEVINMEEISAETHLLLHKKVLNRFQKKIRTRTLSRISSEVLYMLVRQDPLKIRSFVGGFVGSFPARSFEKFGKCLGIEGPERDTVYGHDLSIRLDLWTSCTHRISERIHYKFSDRICREGLYKTTF